MLAGDGMVEVTWTQAQVGSEPSQYSSTVLPVFADGQVTMWPTTLHGYAPSLTGPDAGFPTPFIGVVDAETGNPIVDGKQIPAFVHEHGLTSWTYTHEGREWTATRSAEGTIGTSDDARYEIRFEVPWMPSMFELRVAGTMVSKYEMSPGEATSHSTFRDPTSLTPIVTARLDDVQALNKQFTFPDIKGLRAHSLFTGDCPETPQATGDTPGNAKVTINLAGRQDAFNEWDASCRGGSSRSMFCPIDAHGRPLQGDAELRIEATPDALLAYAWYAHGGAYARLVDGEVVIDDRADSMACLSE